MTDEMIEAGARAIAECDGIPDGFTDFNEYFLDHLPHYLAQGRAAIAAHKSALAKAGLGIRPREPTPDQENAGQGSFDLTKSGRENCVLVWQAMWDAHPDKPDG